MVTVEDGCTTFCTESVLYGESLNSKRYVCCDKLKIIILPDTVTKIDTTSYNTHYLKNISNKVFLDIRTFTVKNKKIQIGELVKLINTLDLDTDDVLKQFPGRIENNNFLYTCDNVLIKYTGMAEKIIIPSGITAISDYAFANNTYVKEIVLPDTVQSIGNGAFSECYNLTKINLPTTITSIASDAFNGTEYKSTGK